MSFAVLFAWLVALPVLHDGHGAPIPRPEAASRVIVSAALEQGVIDPRVMASILDVLAAHESGYRPRALGDGGRSKGAWQTPAHETPDDPLGQARIAMKWITSSSTRCPDHPLSLYATGRVCGSVPVADRYWREVRAELAIPLVVDVAPAAFTVVP